MSNYETLHLLTPCTENTCVESHIILSPPHIENDKEYSVFKLFSNDGVKLYATDDCDDGIAVRLESVYTETDELMPIFKSDLTQKITLCQIEIVKVMKNLPALVSLKRIERFPNEILFKDYTDVVG